MVTKSVLHMADSMYKQLTTNQVPQLNMYSAKQQLHGIHAQHLKNKWQCQQHPGENGQPGACYIEPVTGRHISLNMRWTAVWTAAMV